MCSIVLVDDQGRIRHAAAPNLPREYIDSIEGQPIGPQAGSCGTAAYTRKPVIVEDIRVHPAWAAYRDLALPFGLLACWSTPILTPEGKVLGTFAMYYREPRRPTRKEMEWIEVATHLAYVALISERARATETERQHMRAAVQSSENLRSVILESVGDAIFYLHVEGEGLYRFVWVNRAFSELFGVPAAEMSGRMLHDVLPEDMRASTLVRYAHAASTGECQSWELTMQARTGEKYGEITLVPLFDDQGRCTNFVGTVHDMTARIKAEKERGLLQAKLHQAQRIQALGTLAGGIAHDFNNILAAIGGNTRLLLEETPEDSRWRRHLVEIQKASARASDLVRQILTFSRSSIPTYEVIDPRAVTGEALELLRATLPTNIDIQTHFAPDTPSIKADSTQFHQILINLVTNAAHAYEGANGVVRIDLRSATDAEIAAAPDDAPAPGTYLWVQVADRGSGMDAATLKRVFEPFFTTRSMGKGTGLGLSVVHGIVESHGGSINISSEPKRGTTVNVYLPAADTSAPASKAEAPRKGSGERIMYVDDEEALVFLMDVILTRMGYQIRGYTDPTLALQDFRARPQDVDVVITDVAMPGITGPHLAEKLREIRKDVPIIMTSGYIRDEDREAARALQINQLVYKSDTVEELAEALSKEIAALNAARA